MQPYYTDNDYTGTHVMRCSHCKAISHHKRILMLPVLTREQEFELKSNCDADGWNELYSFLSENNFRLTENALFSSIVENICSCGNITYDFLNKIMPKCDKECIKYSFTRVYPDLIPEDIDSPNEDMPEKCKMIYDEAANVFSISPKASAALLRLCLQEFLNDQEVNGRTIDNQIEELKKQGMDEIVITFMDSCRVVGNNAVHPGEINMEDTPEIAKAQFEFMNIIVEYLITRKRKQDEFLSRVPENVRKKIQKRNAPQS